MLHVNNINVYYGNIHAVKDISLDSNSDRFKRRRKEHNAAYSFGSFAFENRFYRIYGKRHSQCTGS